MLYLLRMLVVLANLACRGPLEALLSMQCPGRG